jgi:hypothetical protein
MGLLPPPDGYQMMLTPDSSNLKKEIKKHE